MEAYKRIKNMEQNVCPACFGAKRSEFEKFGEFTLYKCDNCDLVYSLPMKAMSPDGYGEMYANIGLHGDFATALESGHLEFLKRNKPVAGRNKLLDVGTSTGLFVHSAKLAGFEAVGVETDARAVEAGKKMFPGISLENISLGELSDREDRYNYVTLFEVLEHVSEPRSLLADAKKLLFPGGKLAVFVPNRNRTPKLYKEMVDRGIDLPPHHLSKWSKQSLIDIFKSLGLKNIRVEDVGKYRFPLLPALGIASRVKNRIIKTSAIPSGDNAAAKSKKADCFRFVYRKFADARMLADKALFFWIDLIYKFKGSEKDGLYAEGINDDVEN